MLVLHKIAVTGGIACGKSTVCRYFSDCGAFVLSADQIVHQLLSFNPPTISSVKKLLGEEVAVNGKVDRSLVAQKVFNDPMLLIELEKLLHPLVQQEISDQYQRETLKCLAPVFVVEVPLLYEANMEDFYDAVVVVASDQKLSLQRFKKKYFESIGSDEAFKQRNSCQLPLNDKMKKAHYIIHNNGNLAELKHAVEKLFIILCSDCIRPSK